MRRPEISQKIAQLFKVASLWEDALADPIKAVHAYQRVIELEPSNLLAVHGLQRVHERARQFLDLVSALEYEADLTSDDELVLGLLHRAGTVLDEQLNDEDAALLRFRKVLEMSPAFVPALASLGRIYYRNGRWAELLDMYQRELLGHGTRNELRRPASQDG